MLHMLGEELQNQAPSRSERFAHQVRAAIGIIDSGDTSTLQKLLRDHPELVRVRGEQEAADTPPYFRGATLLHYVAGNPFRRKLPSSIVEVARLLLAAGAAVDARTEEGNTTLGLVASSAEARRAGVQVPLIETLVHAGADVNLDHGTPMKLALFHGEGAAAEALFRQGARLDLRFAAGLGRVELLQQFCESDGRLRPEASLDVSQSEGEVREEALRFACRNGQVEVVDWFLRQGVSINARPGGTPFLHLAASHVRQDLVLYLIQNGADVNARDDHYHGSPLDWCLFMERQKSTPADAERDFLGIAKILREHGGREYFSPSSRSQ
jgi:ankyrin repeat protein